MIKHKMASHVPHSVICLSAVLFILTSSTTLSPDELSKEYDICNLDPVSPSSFLSRPGDFIDIYVNWAYINAKRNSYTCTAYFKTCNQCRIKASPMGQAFDYRECRNKTWTGNSCAADCVFFELVDTYYDFLRARISNSRTSNEFVTQSKHLQVIACGNHIDSRNITMRLRLTSVEKMEVITGNIFGTLSYRTVMSPYFPAPYVKRNESYKYKLTTVSQNEVITVTFDDWMLSPSSTIKFDGTNIVNTISGNNIRPYIISSGPSLTMTFDTGFRNSGSRDNFLGFKAVARFYNYAQDIPRIQTGCDSTMSASEGGIIHLNFAADGQNRDCIWIIKKISNFDGVYLKILRYKTRSDLKASCDYSLEVRGGITSTGDQRLLIKPNDRIPNYAVQHSHDGFYIRVRGCYFDDPVLVSYAMYLNDCYDYREYYKCDNGQCIPESLVCDTYDHCGDGSDEAPGMCDFRTNSVTHLNGANYGYSFSVHVIIPLVVSIVLGIGIMCLLIAFIRRCRNLRNSAYGSRPLNIQQSRGLHHVWFSRRLRMSVTMSSGESPPSYDEVVQSTPVGHLNMAVFISADETTLTQPPSYEDAVSPASATAQNNAGNNSNSIVHDEANTNMLQSNSLPSLTTTLPLSQSLQSDVSPAASSPVATCNIYHQLDTPPPYNILPRYEDALVCTQDSSDSCRTAFTLRNNSKDSDSLSKDIKDSDWASICQKDAAKSGKRPNNVLNSPSKIGSTSRTSDDSNLKEKGFTIERSSSLREINGHITRNAEDEGKDFKTMEDRDGVGRIRDTEHKGCDQQEMALGGMFCGESQESGGINQASYQNMTEVHRKCGRHMAQGGERVDIYTDTSRNNNDHESHKDGLQPFGCSEGCGSTKENNGVNSPKVIHSSRSWSSADLPLDAGRGNLLDFDKEEVLKGKRFSYRVVDDCALVGQSLDVFYRRKGSENKKLNEYLDRLHTDSWYNRENGYRMRQHENRKYESEDGDYEHYLIKPSQNQPDVSRSKRDKPYLSCSLGPALEPFLESS